MCIDSVLVVIMHSAMVAMVHQWVRANTALREAKGARAARRHSALLRRGQRKPRPAGPGCTQKKWSFSELRTFFPKNLSYRRVDFLRNLRSRGKLQSFLRVGLYCTVLVRAGLGYLSGCSPVCLGYTGLHVVRVIDSGLQPPYPWTGSRNWELQ